MDQIGYTRDGVAILARDIAADPDSGPLPVDPALWEDFASSTGTCLLPL